MRDVQPKTKRAWLGRLVAGLLLGASVAGVAVVRPKLADALEGTQQAVEIYTLPPPEALPVASLGYRSALADLLFTKSIIAHAQHSERKQRYDAIADYLEAIIALDPTLRDVYRFADSLIVYHAVGEPTPELLRRAWRILETGLELRPGDADLWLSSGQFMAFMAPQWLKDEEEKKAFRAVGARQLSRAAEIAGETNENISWQALAAVGVYTRAGERQAAINYLERAYLVTDSEELREQIARRLSALRQDAELDRIKRLTESFSQRWKDDLPFVSRTKLLVLGPRWDSARCVGKPASTEGCEQSWADWAKRIAD